MEPVANNEPHLSRALERVDGLVRQVAAAGFGRSRVVLAGFSQGACLAAEYLYRNGAAQVGSAMVLTGGVIGPDGTAWPVRPKLDGLRLLLTSSETDEWIPPHRARQTAHLFRARGAQVMLRIYPGRAHEIGGDEIELARTFLSDSSVTTAGARDG